MGTNAGRESDVMGAPGNFLRDFLIEIGRSLAESED